MAIIVKMVGGKALIVGGKLSINPACCCNPFLCCLWPSPGLFEGSTIYPPTDTPDTLPITAPFIGGVTSTQLFTRVLDPFYNDFLWEYTFVGSGDPEEGIPDVKYRLFAVPDGGVFQLSDGSGNGAESPCLIGTWDGIFDGGPGVAIVEDGLPSTTSASFDYLGDTYTPTLTRDGICCYKGSFSPVGGGDDITVRVCYDGTFTITGTLQWIYFILTEFGGKDDPQSSPIGEYDDSGTVTNFEIT